MAMCALRALCVFLYIFSARGSCPATDEEKQIADYVKERQSRVASGEIAKQIAAGTYTSDSLSNDMYRWWVQIGLASHNVAIENFVNLMQKAKEKAEKSDWLSVFLGWLGLIIGAAGEEVELLAKAVEAMKTALETWKTAAEGQEGSDFLTVAINFRAQLPTKETTQLRVVDDFINEVRNIPKTQHAKGLLAAYQLVTKVIASTISYRKAFNQYYFSFLSGAKLGDLAFYYSWNAPNGNVKNRIWATTPSGLDACTVANFVRNLNLGCVSRSTPGLEKLTNAVQVTVNQGPGAGIRLDCGNLDLKSFTGCWIQGRLLSKDNSNCFTVYQQARSSYGWPSSDVKDFCNNMISSSSSYTACGYDGYFQGPAACAHNANLYSCRRGDFSVIVNHSAHVVV